MASTERETSLLQGRSTLYIAFAVIMAICALLWLAVSQQPALSVAAREPGVFVLDDGQLAEPVFEISGSMQTIPNALLDPGQFAQTWAGLAQAPSSADNPADAPVATYTNRMVIELPIQARDSYYAIGFDSDDLAMTVYVNGTRLGSSAQQSVFNQDILPGYDLYYIEAKPNRGSIELVFAVQAHGMAEPPFSARMLFGQPQAVQDMQLRGVAAASMVMAAFFTLALAMAVFWLMNRASRASIYFALLCVSWGLYLAVTWDKALLLLLPTLSWTAGYRIEYVSITIAMFALAYVI
jgi:hypothetical protein